MTKGFAAINQRGEILVKTVSETRRAAMVNWLVTELHFMITLNHTDDAIDELFRRNAVQRGLAAIEEVSIAVSSPVRCQVCGEPADLTCGPSRFGDKTWACKDCWEPDCSIIREAGK